MTSQKIRGAIPLFFVVLSLLHLFIMTHYFFGLDIEFERCACDKAKLALRGANLLCFCAPKPYCGDFLLDLVNVVEEEDLFD